MRLCFLISFIIITKQLDGAGFFSYKLWNKQRLISEVVKNYLLSCQKLDILRNEENLRKVYKIGNNQKVNFWEQLEILVDLPKFCDQKEFMSAKFGQLDCFEMPKNGDLLRLLNEYKIQVQRSEKFIRRLLVCKLIFRMDRPKVSEKSVKALVVDFLTEKEKQEIVKSVNYQEKKQILKDKRLVLIDYEASDLLWRLKDLLHNIYHLYNEAEILNGLQTNIKTSVNIKKNAVETNVRMQTSIRSKRRLKDACKILQANNEIFDFIETHNTLSNMETIFIQIKKVGEHINKILKRDNHSGSNDKSAQNDISECISDLVILSVITEFYQSLIDAIAQKVQTSEDNSYKVFCHERGSNCSKDLFMRDLFEMKKKAELLNASINAWFKRKLIEDEYGELKHQLKSNVYGHFPIMIIENEKPKHGGIVARMENGLRKIRDYQPTWDSTKAKKKIKNNYRYFYSTPKIKRIRKHKPRIYVVEEPPRPAYYYQKRFKKGFWNN
ncbi:hypothetical protein ACQ4LE_003619 [Meloidogyne hapla]